MKPDLAKQLSMYEWKTENCFILIEIKNACLWSKDLINYYQVNMLLNAI